VQWRVMMVGALLVLALAGCQSMNESADALTRGAAGAAVGGLLTPLGGAAVDGSVVFQRRDNAATMVVHMTGGAPGVYRVVIHATGNCSSRNGFSAGAPWVTTGGAPIVITMATNTEGTATMSTRIPGLALQGPDGVFGKSVVIHEGSVGPLDAKPELPNGRIACAVIGTAPSMFR